MTESQRKNAESQRKMTDREKVIQDLQDAVNDDWMWQHADFYARTMGKAIQLLKEQEEEIENLKQVAQSMMEGICLLKEQEAVVRCKDCKYWVPGVITDRDDFIPPKCGKYSQMVGHSADDFCSLAEQEVTGDE